MKMNEAIRPDEKIRNLYELPAVESFFDKQALLQNWPENITSDKDFLSQIESRKQLQNIIEQICSKLPQADLSLESAIKQGVLSEDEVGKLYESLTNLLDSDQNYERIILYLPFEFLPASSWQTENPKLTQEITRFKTAYMLAWEKLLSFHDVRANFVDGDVLDQDLREDDLIRVVKAAHLLPILAQKGFITTAEILDIMDRTHEPLLKQNIGEALYVMLDMGLIDSKEVPENLPIVKHAEEPKIITDKRKAWLIEKEAQESNQLLQKPNDGAEKLTGPFSENIKNMRPELIEIKNSLALIENNPELLKYIYPVTLIYGSRLKGYGTANSDIDLGIFIKPNTPFDERFAVHKKLKEIFTHEMIHGEIIEFWIEYNNDELSIKDFEGFDPVIGDSYRTHVLFGSVWEGDPNLIKEIRNKLLPGYMYDDDQDIDGEKARPVYLGEIERDNLQYRLMHKGYQRFYPPCGGIRTPNSDRIDSKSMFWDSGFRQLATRLFVQRVFLPKISKPKK